jgi:endonuclease/exonuclease/phosphatase family metal-dependent hydrolase
MLNLAPCQSWFLAIVLMAGCNLAEPETPTAAAPKLAPPVKPLVFMTYNVLADPIAPEERTKSLLEIIRSIRPDVIALQEVAPWFLDELLEQPWVREEYHAPLFDDKLVAPGGQYILSKYPIERADWIILSGKQQRTAIAVHLEIAGRKVAVATSHMESMLEDGPVRAKQLDEIFALVDDADNAVVLGDFNFGDREAEESHIPPSYRDLWAELHPHDPGYTWNIEVSEMARSGSFPGEPSRRIDRILVSLSGYQPTWIKIVGNEPLVEGGTIFPSDHFGLVGAVSLIESH